MTISRRKILTPHVINSLHIRNRLAVAPMTRVSASESGHATTEMTLYYKRFARGGFGLIISEGLYTDQVHAQGYRFQPGITDAAQAESWQAVIQQVHDQQSSIFAQIMHAGALSQGNRFVEQTVAPSAIRPKGEQMTFYFGQGQYPLPKAMSDEDIADAIAGFANTARLSIGTAGFDGIEIHAANGYLLDQFLTSYTNQRTDRWGGNTRARVGLTLEVVKSVRDAVGLAVPVGVRISQGKVNDYTHKWANGEADAEVIFGSLEDAGVDFIHVTEHEAWQPAFSNNSESLVALARRYAPAAMLIANGGLQDSSQAEKVLSDGADIIAIGKAALANPDYPARLTGALPMRDFDAALLGPIANIKSSELTS